MVKRRRDCTGGNHLVGGGTRTRRGNAGVICAQSPQKLAALREHALIESAQSSNRIEGVEVDASRLGTLVFGAPAFRDRDEEEVNGYRLALDLIHSSVRAAGNE